MLLKETRIELLDGVGDARKQYNKVQTLKSAVKF